ncbi:MAG TPA: DNA mismatch repair protein MutS [Mycobacteriales bacterium]|nr:DNA mismatch repair protein MutS [Mycobacteriales bacterium]
MAAGSNAKTVAAGSQSGLARAAEPRRVPSLLWPVDLDARIVEAASEPDYFHDLNLDQLAGQLLAGVDQGDRLADVLYSPLGSADVVYYRQEVFRDLEDPRVDDALRLFVDRMDDVHRHFANLEKRIDRYERDAWFVDAASLYCRALRDLVDVLDAAELRSRGLTAVRDALDDYVASEPFVRLLGEATDAQAALTRVRYCIRVKGSRVEVSRYQGQEDYSVEVGETFRRFQQGEVKDYRVQYRSEPFLGHVGSHILELLARLFPTEFSGLDEFCAGHADFLAEQVNRLAFESGFYLAYRRYMAPLVTAGLPFCYPTIDESSGDIEAEGAFDICLASMLVAEGRQVVQNSLRLDNAERIFVVSGPNQGGKTTFARMFGQLHHLAAVGCPVPGATARLGLFDRIFTHFQREEQVSDLRGKLEDDLVRIHATLQVATARSIVILNEIFTSTTLDDARLLGAEIMHKLIDRGVRGVYVTFVDELASIGPAVVSVMSEVVPDDPARRTFRIIRAPANGLAYALAIAAKYDLTYERLRNRLVR